MDVLVIPDEAWNEDVVSLNLKNLWVIFDRTLSKKHMSNVCKTAHCIVFKGLWRSVRLWSWEGWHAFVSIRLDYCNSALSVWLKSSNTSVQCI